MNSTSITILLWVLTVIGQILGFRYLAAVKKGRDEKDIESIGPLSARVLKLETDTANIKGFLEGRLRTHL
jgi:hypothetical protein